MAELADAHGSGPCDSNIMRVQVPFSARILGCGIPRPIFFRTYLVSLTNLKG